MLIDNQGVPPAPPEERLAAFFQPIVALDTRRIAGFEALGRLVDGDSVRSLGPFFSDPRVPVAEQLRIDRLLREQAIAKAGAAPDPPTIFLNLKPSWIHRHYRATGELHTLSLLGRYNIDPRKICIEITEEEFGGSASELSEVIKLYRDQGCQIAIDDIGSGFSSYDRIAQIQPNVLKIDIHLMKKSAYHSGYLGVLRSFSTLAEQIGASLLIEGVETREDLQRAIHVGARYVQGYLFAPAEPSFREKDAFAALIERELHEHRRLLQQSEREWHDRGMALARSALAAGVGVRLEAIEASGTSGEDANAASEHADEAIGAWLPRLDETCLRVYLCGRNGIQLSSNHTRHASGGWNREEDYRGSDWNWRPYFIPHLLEAEGQTPEMKVSPKYADLDTHAWIRTISIPVGRELVLFLDIADR
ncbi:EAL domain-containing protein [Cohnella zeiphila]|uniref:EAL domain-containing protein n=1 Tax=Cohnella zeiphila TaxID=2761120 RepID=A0A7X0VX11_9BACL|nr:EAL domain-containing protein [Cohnella zeiphila]MBB6733794.1 EAL domain-containing protein [Cohnella zeiphila]